MRGLVSLLALALAAPGLASAQTYGGQTYGGQASGGQASGTRPYGDQGQGSQGYGGQGDGGQGYGGQTYGGPTYGGQAYGAPDQGYMQPEPRRDGDGSAARMDGYDGSELARSPDGYPSAPQPPSSPPNRSGYGQGSGSNQGGYGQSGYGQSGYGQGRGAQPGRVRPDDVEAPYPPSREPAPVYRGGGELRSGYGYVPAPGFQSQVQPRSGTGAAPTPLSALLTCEGGGFGRDLGCRIARGDVRWAEGATLRALAEGAPQDWSNPRTGAYGHVAVTAGGYGQGGDRGQDGYRGAGGCRVVEESVTPSAGRTETQRFRACPVSGETGGEGGGYGADGEGSRDWTFARM